MAWKPITIDDVLSEFSQVEQASYTAATQSGQAVIPAVAAILQREVGACRGSVKAGGGIVGPDGTVPEQLMPALVAIVKWRWIGALPMMDSLKTKDRQDPYTEARDTMMDVANGKLKVELPTDLASLQNQDPAPVNQVQVVTHGGQGRFTQVCPDGSVHSKLDGLI